MIKLLLSIFTQKIATTYNEQFTRYKFIKELIQVFACAVLAVELKGNDNSSYFLEIVLIYLISLFLNNFFGKVWIFAMKKRVSNHPVFWNIMRVLNLISYCYMVFMAFVFLYWVVRLWSNGQQSLYEFIFFLAGFVYFCYIFILPIVDEFIVYPILEKYGQQRKV